MSTTNCRVCNEPRKPDPECEVCKGKGHVRAHGVPSFPECGCVGCRCSALCIVPDVRPIATGFILDVTTQQEVVSYEEIHGPGGFVPGLAETELRMRIDQATTGLNVRDMVEVRPIHQSCVITGAHRRVRRACAEEIEIAVNRWVQHNDPRRLVRDLRDVMQRLRTDKEYEG